MIVQLRNVYMASLGLTGSPDTEQVHDAFKLVIHHFGRFLVDLFSELPRHDVLALPELAEQPWVLEWTNVIAVVDLNTKTLKR